MAIGDAIAVFMGTGTVNRQPASGVEEQISSIVKPGATDDFSLYDGTNLVELLNSAVVTRLADPANTAQTGQQVFNTAIMITNSIYLRKTGTTDRIYVGGVQTNA